MPADLKNESGTGSAMAYLGIVAFLAIVGWLAYSKFASATKPATNENLSERQKAEILLALIQRSIKNMEAFSRSSSLSKSDLALVQEHLESQRRNVPLLAKQARGEKLVGVEHLSNFMVRNFEISHKALSNETGSEFGGTPERLVGYLKHIKQKPV